jgi:C4-dicarboxylate-specific signal transduction histidine kinase
LLLGKLPLPRPNRRYIELIDKVGRRAAELTSYLLGFARQGKREAKPVAINQTIHAVLELLSTSMDKKIKLRTDSVRKILSQVGIPTKYDSYGV